MWHSQCRWLAEHAEGQVPEGGGGGGDRPLPVALPERGQRFGAQDPGPGQPGREETGSSR